MRFDGRDLLGALRRAPARARRARPRDGLPGPDDVAAPDAHGRPAADRARPAPPRLRPPRRRAPRARAARAGAHPGRAGGAPRVPAPVLGRDAPADRDRDRPRLPPEAADRRRADDGARRHRAGRDPPAARPPPPRERPRGDPDHARPRRDVGDRRPRLDLLRRPGRRVGLARGRPPPPAPPVHARAARRAAAPRAAARPAARRDPRLAAEPRQHPARVRVQPALRLRAGGLPRATCPQLVAANGRALACPVDPFAAR